jgi:hypothetical protein
MILECIVSCELVLQEVIFRFHCTARSILRDDFAEGGSDTRTVTHERA